MPVTSLRAVAGGRTQISLFCELSHTGQEETQLAGEDENPRSPFGLCRVALWQRGCDYSNRTCNAIAESLEFLWVASPTPLKRTASLLQITSLQVTLSQWLS